MDKFVGDQIDQQNASMVQYEMLQGLFSAYLHDSDTLYERQKDQMGEMFKRYLSMDELRTSPIHKKFYEDAQASVSQLVESLTEQPAPDLAKAAIELFLRKKPKDMEGNQRSWLIAAEALAIPLVPFLERSDAASLCEEYESHYQLAEMMPKQRELYNVLCDAAGKKRKKMGLLAAFISGVAKETTK